MINVFATSNHIDKRYDLKGSKIGRRVLKGNSEEDKKILNSGDMALKDLDFESRKEKVFIGRKKDLIISQLERDTSYLEKIGSNDYSLLLGIHNLENKPRISVPSHFRYNKSHTINHHDFNTLDERKKELFRKFTSDKDSDISQDAIDTKKKFRELYDFDDGGILSSTGKKVYYIGIIDILTEYGFAKKTEHLAKMIRYCSEKMSCIPPKKYKERYIKYMKNNIFDDREFLREITLDKGEKIDKKNLCNSQNLNNELNKVNKNVIKDEENKSDDNRETEEEKYKNDRLN